MQFLASVALVLCFSVWFVNQALPRVDRVLVVFESTHKSPTQLVRDPIPPDLLEWSRSWSDPWAQEAATKTVMEAYERTGTWDGARALLPSIAQNPDSES